MPSGVQEGDVDSRGPPRLLAMSVLVLGLSHRTCPVAVREKAALSESGLRALLRELGASGDLAEAVALSTCNRTEVYVCAHDPARAEQTVAAALLARTRIEPGELACARYLLREERAVAQLFRVAASLDSMVVGESEIQGQVRLAWQIAGEEQTAGTVLDQLFRRSLEVGKDVRSSTRIGAGSASVSAAAVDLARQALPDLAGRRVLVIGAGGMAEAAASALARQGVRDVVVANRAVTRARELAARVGGRGVALDRIAEELERVDVVISATGAPHAILDPGRIAQVIVARPGRPIVIVDISVPRDVEAEVGDIPGVSLFDIDDVERVVEANLNGRRAEAARGEAHVREAVGRFSAWRRGREAGPAIASLRERAEAIRRAELERAQGRWEGLTDADKERLDALTAGIVNKILHEPTVRARQAAETGDTPRHLESLRHLFGLPASPG